MDIYYGLCERLLPFTWVEHRFMLHALATVFLVTPLFGMLGTMVVNNKMAFFSDAIGHSALTGIGIGVIIGLMEPLGAMIIFAVFMAFSITYLRRYTQTSSDTVIGVFSAVAIALGIMILSRGGGFNKYAAYLIGDILSISPVEIKFLVIIVFVFLIYWYCTFNSLMYFSIHPALAKSKGVNIFFVETTFVAILAVMVTISIQWVGIMIINSLLILPAAASRNIAVNIRQYHFFAVLISTVSGVVGLILSYYLDTATGATIVLVAALFYAASLVKKIKIAEG